MEKKRHIETLFQEHYQAMYRLAFMLLHDEEDSRDVVHDVFAMLLKGDIRFDEGKAKAFLMSCVRNSCLNLMRSHNTREQAIHQYSLKIDHQDIDESFEDEIAALREGINHLTPPVCREIILLHYNDGLTFKEIASRLQVSESTVYKHLRSALNQLRLTIKNMG